MFLRLSTYPVLFAAFIAGSLTQSASAQLPYCSDRSLNGSYGYTVVGNVTAAFGPLVVGPFAAVGRLVFDGQGHVKTVRTLSDNGGVLTNDSGSGTYLVNSDCTGSFNISVGPPNNITVLTLNLVIDDTDQIRAIVTNQGTVLTLEGRKQLPITL
jgi:hypothetical protein